MDKRNLVIIDADSLIYLVGYELSEMHIEIVGTLKLDKFIKGIMEATLSSFYIGFYGGKGVNFRYDVATVTPYKGARNKTEKPAWFHFWEPVLKSHMKNKWGFQECENIEADDAAIIAYNKFKDEFDTVTIASPDKDLKQQPGRHYDYKKIIKLDVNENAADMLLASQLLEGDSADSIPGLPGVGKGAITKIFKDYSTGTAVDFVEKYYYTYFQKVLVDKQTKKQEKDHLTKYKVDNDIKRLTSKIKSEALGTFKFDNSEVKSDKEVKSYFDEMYKLLHMLTTEEEGLVHGFVLGTYKECTTLDLESLELREELLGSLPTEIDFGNNLDLL